jgi:hypothetical protein
MEPDQLQWVWDGVDNFRIKFSDLCERAVQNFQLPFDVAQHELCSEQSSNLTNLYAMLVLQGSIDF